MKFKEFFINVARGAAIGVSMIIPGVSGGTIAVLLNVYEKLIDSVSNLRKEFKKSIAFLLPILLGAALAIIAMYFPIKFALEKAPLPTVLFFAGLIVGSVPKVLKDAISGGFKVKVDIAASVIPLLVVIGICFIPGLGDANLTSSMPVYGYILLILVGAAASCALVVPGISGSMLLLIFGYYNSVLDTVSALKTSFGHSLLVLVLLALGILVGFFSIAKLMKFLLSKFPRATRWAIIGFVLGSIPAIFITYNQNFPEQVYSSVSAAQIAVGVVLCVIGAVGTFLLTVYAEKIEKKKAAEIQSADEATYSVATENLETDEKE
ncbi:MAG: DUF368 domain-containing protein [Clostridia bacterium]|nr:DUF368 domain-containing protein [Clostridia bacterium]